MLNKPKFMSPSTNMQECTIDVSADKIPFSCIVDGNEAINAWQIIIYSLSDNSVILDTGKIELSTPFFPVDEKNRNVVFPFNLRDYLGDNSVFCNRVEPYYWTITFWGTSGGQTTSCEEVFYANTTPHVDILFKSSSDEEYSVLQDAQAVDSKSCVFKAVYKQGEGVTLKKYGWRLKSLESEQVIVDTISHNQIYGLPDNMKLEYDGFLANENYSIEVYVETQNNVSVYTAPIIFSVEYITTFLSGDFKVEALKNESGIMLDWSESIVAGGKMYDESGNIVNVDNVPFAQNYPVVEYSANLETGEQIPSGTSSVIIPENYSVVYDYGASFNLNISEDSYIVLSTQLPDNTDKLLLNIEGTDEVGDAIFRRLSFSNNSFEYIVLGKGGRLFTKKYAVNKLPSSSVWYVITLSPILQGENTDDYVKLTVAENVIAGALYPSTTLYSSTSLYPHMGTWITSKVGEA